MVREDGADGTAVITATRADRSVDLGLTLSVDGSAAHVATVNPKGAMQGKVAVGDALLEINGAPAAGLEQADLNGVLGVALKLTLRVRPAEGGGAAQRWSRAFSTEGEPSADTSPKNSGRKMSLRKSFSPTRPSSEASPSRPVEVTTVSREERLARMAVFQLKQGAATGASETDSQPPPQRAPRSRTQSTRLKQMFEAKAQEASPEPARRPKPRSGKKLPLSSKNSRLLAAAGVDMDA